ncbi:peptidoglycan DD-metalloendopeptidase family protein [Massilia glaciei]|uniref:M23 family peptidase n=1 Tax=Massilia glaciei TaxID=1524097 RepID=A0A2U2HFT6_9BURK|nr:peptidoglycan DD-metalloendopeptidase family protein [Massilia glaciei]PWF43395.1 M23 family peptidase [Massilia glaciei]
MSAPKLVLTIEPSESGAVVYLPLSPKVAGGEASGHLALKITVKNNEPQPVTLKNLIIASIGTPTLAAVTIPIMAGANRLRIAANATASWFFQPDNNISLPMPAPGQIKLSLSADGFPDPVVLIMPLKPHRSPVAGGSYDFPAKAHDFRVGEYWSGRGESHAAAGDGSQLFAYDMGVIAFDPASKGWNDKLAGKDGSQNNHYRIWGKPIYAMADGTVIGFKNDMPNNTKMGTQAPTPSPVEGNHFWLQHGDEAVVYAHLQPNSLNSKFTKLGAAIKRGDFLGLAGNSGNSTAPHLHIHAIEATKPWAGPLRPLPFRNTYMIDRTALTPPDAAVKWVKAEDQGFSEMPMAIWPATTAPAWYPPGWGEVTRNGIPEANYQAEFDRATSSGYRPVWIDGYEVNGRVYFNAIFHPNDGNAWAARHGMTGAQYQAEFDSRTGQGFHLYQIESYLSGNEVRYASIFVKSAASARTAYHGLTREQHQQKFDTLTAAGWRPINLSVVSPNNKLSYAGLYEKRDVGAFFAKSFLSSIEYQAQFTTNTGAGRKLMYLNAYTHAGAPHFTAIWQEKAPSVLARHGQNAAQFQEEFNKQLSSGSMTRLLTGYEDNDGHRFGAAWA